MRVIKRWCITGQLQLEHKPSRYSSEKHNTRKTIQIIYTDHWRIMCLKTKTKKRTNNREKITGSVEARHSTNRLNTHTYTTETVLHEQTGSRGKIGNISTYPPVRQTSRGGPWMEDHAPGEEEEEGGGGQSCSCRRSAFIPRV